MKVVLLTGATGVLGSVVAPLFLDDADTELRVLLRADSAQQADRRLDALVADWGEPYGAPEFRARVRALRGDVTAEKLGLDSSDHHTQVQTLTHIVHCAANVNMRMTESEATRISVDSAREVLALAESAGEAGPFEKLDFVSTLGVAGTRRGQIPEQPDLGLRGFHNTYESSKSEAERLVFDKMASGLSLTVHRPSMIVGESRTGHIRQFQIFYYICEFLTGRFTAGFLPDTRTVQLDTVPVDFAARAIKWSSGSPSARGQLLHLCSGPDVAIRIKELGRRVRDQLAGPARPRTRQVPLPVFTGLVRALKPILRGKRGRALANLSLLLDHLNADQRFENRATLGLLNGAGITLPRVEDYLEEVMGYYRRTGRG